MQHQVLVLEVGEVWDSSCIACFGEGCFPLAVIVPSVFYCIVPRDIATTATIIPKECL